MKLTRMLLLGIALGSFYTLFQVVTFQDYAKVTIAVTFTILAAREN